MSAQDNNGGDSPSSSGEQTDRAAEKSDEVGSYSPEQYPEDPEPATTPGDERASEPPKSD
ncbi:hypothetical protein [Mycobacterium sp.]|uniref:hypothetical protein n=1 Tax=Mycobacterium sp. TaxID=1785 RepID=UPI003D1049B2